MQRRVLDVASGQVVGEIIARNDADTFIGFLSVPDQPIDPSRPIHVALDNGDGTPLKAA